MLCLDKRAFFLVSTSDVGAQIYELVANSKDEKNKYVHSQLFRFCHTFWDTCWSVVHVVILFFPFFLPRDAAMLARSWES